MRHDAQRGFTMTEITVVIALSTLLMLAVGQVQAASSGLAARSRLDLRANEDLRRNLEALANTLRAADFDSVQVVEGTGVPTEVTYRRVLGADRFGPVLAPAEQLVWKAYPRPLPGVPRPGWVAHVRDGVETLIADRVPEGGFHVALQDGLLQIRIRTYYVLQNQPTVVEGRTALFPRN